MGIIDFFKGGLPSTRKKVMDEEMNSYLDVAKTNLRSGFEFMGNFLDGLKGFEPAHRHYEMYNTDVKAKLINIRKEIRNGIIFIEEKLKNTVNTMNTIKSLDQLRDMINNWILALESEDSGILKTLNKDMWGPEMERRMFPIPKNKILVCGYLITSINYLKRAKESLDNYNELNNIPEAA
ncbi:hypothetical protein J4216_01585 [Candidatus Woesearchaeota archaeon]|nr:hypothetical protein [Candidatus Woesearchaeota archaeon]